MICRNCNAAMGPQDDECRVCDYPARKGRSTRKGLRAHEGSKNWPKFIKVAAALLVLTGGVIFVVLYTTDRLDFAFFTNRDAQTPIPQENEPVADGGAVEAPDDAATSVIPDPTPARRDEEARLALLTEVYYATVNFMAQFSPQIPFVSNMGYLYDMNHGVFITTETLSVAGLLDYEHLHEPKLILFLRPSSFVPFEEIEMPVLDQMTIFVGHDTVTGIGLYSSHGYREIFRENLNELLLGYIPNGGEIVRPSSAHPVYQAAHNIIGRDNDIRYMAFDDDFLFASFSAAGAGHELRHRVLQRTEAGLITLPANLDDARHPVQAINHVAPNFNLELLPYFEISRDNLLPPGSPVFDILLSGLRAQELVGPYDEPEFASAVNSYAYLVFPGNQTFPFPRAFLARLGDEWVFEPVSGWQHAEQLLWEWAEVDTIPVSLYILRQD